MKIEQYEKYQIRNALEDYVNLKGSQVKASKSLEGVSTATISQILNDNWELINLKMWRTVANQIGYSRADWELAETADFKELNKVFLDAKENSLVMSIVGNEGTGKSKTIEHFTAKHENVYSISCAEYWDKRVFLRNILKTLGADPSGMGIPDMVDEVVRILQSKEEPQLIFDEADKLRDQVLLFFITFFNVLEDYCSMILISTQFQKKRILRGLTLNLKGYREIYSRLGKRFIEMNGLSYTDVVKICTVNGVEPKWAIKEIYEDCELDIRRVKRLVHAHHKTKVKVIELCKRSGVTNEAEITSIYNKCKGDLKVLTELLHSKSSKLEVEC